jgi:hypothetical protein
MTLSSTKARTDVSNCGSYPDLDARVALLSELALEELVQFGIENTVSDELAAFGDGSLCSGHDCTYLAV